VSEIKELTGTSWELERDYYMDFSGEGKIVDKITFLDKNKLEIVNVEPMAGDDKDNEPWETGPWKFDGKKIEISFNNYFILKGELKTNVFGEFYMDGSYTSQMSIKAHSENTYLEGKWRAFAEENNEW
tara:strand:- start:141 stop:524 length:384 start_codon:yes stop_codon:yes gene_type:complete